MPVRTRGQQQALRFRTMATAPIRNIWSKNGLDLADSAFSKVYLSEVNFSQKDDAGEALKKFDLESTRFEELRTMLIANQNRMAMKKLLQVQEAGVDLDLLDQPQLISKPIMVAHRAQIWDVTVDLANTSQEDVNKVFDRQLKCHAFGNFLLNALSNRAIQKLESSKSQWTVTKDDEEYVHGPLLFWYIVDAVKPNNDTLVQHTKEKLAKLNVKEFEYSIRDLLIEFDNLCMEVEVRLKGTLTEDEKISSLWRGLESMKDEHFSKVVSDEKRLYRRTPAAARKSCSELVELFKREQTDLEADGKWNCPNKDSQILALTSVLKSVVHKVNNVASGGRAKPTGDSNKPLKKKRTTPAWKFERENDELQKTVDDRTYWWCEKHTNPSTGKAGMWVLHKPEDHKENFRDKKIPTNTSEDTQPDPVTAATVNVDSRLLNALSSGSDIQHFLDSLDTNDMELN